MLFFDWLALCAVCFIGAIIPGPSFLLITEQALSLSTKHGCIAAIAHACGIGVWAFATASGVSLLLLEFTNVYLILLYCSAVFFLYIGIKALCAPVNSLPVNRPSASVNRPLVKSTLLEVANVPTTIESPKHLLSLSRFFKHNSYAVSGLKGFGIAFLNPKSVVFFTALYSQFIPADQLSLKTLILLVLTPFVIDAAWFCALCCGLSRFKARFTHTLFIFYLTKISGVVFIGVAVKTIMSL